MSLNIDVAYVAELARIALTDDEKALFQSQLETVVGYVNKIGALKLGGVQPTMHGQVSTNFFREDVVCPSLGRAKALANAPARTESEFKLPKIVEES